MVKKVIQQIEPINEEELEKDLRFIWNNRSETEDQFLEELIPTIKYHLNEAMARYQVRLINDLGRQLKNEVIGIVVRNKRGTIVEEDDNEWGS